MAVELWEMFVFAVVQAVTEWMPVSSSGHLVLLGQLGGFNVGIRENVIVHLGTLFSVMVYFWKDIGRIIGDVFRGRLDKGDGRLGLYVVVASIPAGIIGFLFKDYFDAGFESLEITGLGFLITGVFLLIASKDWNVKVKLGFRQSFLIGVSQAFAIIPGISRSGATIGFGLLLGLNEKEAMKFSFLMAIPIILGANIVGGGFVLDGSGFFMGLTSFIFGLGTIHLLFDKILKNRKNLKWFGIYALVLGISILIFFM
jgi:undecaprenyl-diphosphatase